METTADSGLLALCTNYDLGVGQGGQRLVKFGGQQQPFEVATESLTLGLEYRSDRRSGLRSPPAVQGPARRVDVWSLGGTSSLCRHWSTSIIFRHQTTFRLSESL
jgi:hypothetical protein